MEKVKLSLFMDRHFEIESALTCLMCVGEEREIQKSYWVEHSTDLTVEAMMLDSKAADLDKEERPEVCFFLFKF